MKKVLVLIFLGLVLSYLPVNANAECGKISPKLLKYFNGGYSRNPAWPKPYLEGKNKFLDNLYRKVNSKVGKNILDRLHSIPIKASYLKNEKAENFTVKTLYKNELANGGFVEILTYSQSLGVTVCQIHEIELGNPFDRYMQSYELVFSGPELHAIYLAESKKPRNVRITKLIYDDSSCVYTKYKLIMVTQDGKKVSPNGFGVLILGQESKDFTKAKLSKVSGISPSSKDPLKDLSTWSLDLDGDDIADSAYMMDFKGRTDMYRYYFSLFNLAGKWKFTKVLDSNYWDNGC